MPQGVGMEAKSVAGALTNMRIDELISNMAIGIAEGQMELDKACMEIAQFMGDAQIAFGKRAGSDEPDLLSLVELGFSPNFYQFVDTILEIRVSVSTQFEESREYNVSQQNQHIDEYQRQDQYERRSSSSSSGTSDTTHYGWYGWWGWGGRHGKSSSAYASSGSSRTASASSYKRKNVSINTVDAKYASTYNYAVEGSSLIKTKIVPIPPPQVFEEIVRAKVQERKDEEQRLRWTKQSKSRLGTVAANTTAVLADKNGLAKGTVGFKKENATAIQDAVNKIQEEYNGLTTDHWSVITDSVEIREAADNALNTVSGDVQKLVDSFPEDGSLPEDTSVKDLLAGIKTACETLKAKVDALLAKIPAAG